MSEPLEAEAPLDDAVEPQEPTVQADEAGSAEDRALTMGWTPKEQFKGDPAKWVDAETFVKRGEEFLPFLKANNKRQEREIAKLREAVDRSVQHISKADQRAYERARRDLEAELERAAEAGDTAGVKAVAKEIVDLEKEVVAKPEDQPVWETPAGKAALTEFRSGNPWFEKDRVMTAAAVEIAGELAEGGLIEPKAQLAEVSRRMRVEFAHKFTNPRRADPAAVEGAGAGRRTSAKGYSDLPADARQFCDELVRDKITSRDKYVAEYFKEAK